MIHDVVKSTFTNIFNTNAWGDMESVSGSCSTEFGTRDLRKKFQSVLKRYGIEMLLDLPCGDFNWMRHIDMEGIRYIGGDIVSDLILHHRRNYSSPVRQFHEMDLITTKLPQSDMIFCRDCFVHLSEDLIKLSLVNIKKSNSTYLMSTTFPDIKETSKGSVGGWRPINLCDKVFGLPNPLELIEDDRRANYGRKCLGIWYIGDL